MMGKSNSIVAQKETNDEPKLSYSVSSTPKKLKDVEMGSPAKQYKNRFLQVCSFILVMEICERLSYYTFQTNLAIFIKKELGKDSTTASMYTGLFSTIVYVTPLAGAYVADSIAGRYRTIMWFSVLYAFGLFLIAIAALPEVHEESMFLIGLFVFIAFGAGGIKANVVTLGADQFNPRDPEELKQMGSFFNWFYWMINVGTILATLVLSNFALTGIGPIKKSHAFAASYFVAALFFIVSLIIFYMGKKRYIRKPPAGSAIARFFTIMRFLSTKTFSAGIVLFGFSLWFVGIVFLCILVLDDKESMGKLVKNILEDLTLASIVNGSLLMMFFARKVDWVEKARENKNFTKKEVNGAKELLRMFPYLVFMVPFWVIHGALHGPWANQGCQMNTFVFSSTEQYSPGSWSFWLAVVICVLIPLFDLYLYPWVGRIIGRPEGPTALQKIGAGYVVGILAMVLSGIFEMQRRNSDFVLINGEKVGSICDADNTSNPRYLRDFSMWYQMIPYALLGVSEMLCSITAYDLFYNQVPKSMKSACQGLNLFTDAIGAALNVIIQSILKSNGSLTDNLDLGRQEDYYFSVAAFAGLMLIPFIIFSRSFEYKTPGSDELSDDEDGSGIDNDRISRLSHCERLMVTRVSTT